VSSETSGFLFMDDGSDEHCCGPSFGQGVALTPTDARLRDVQSARPTLHGQRDAPMVSGGQFHATATFQVGDVYKAL
jgi:hypothetical protein